MTGSSAGRQDRDRARRVVREARNELLASGDPWLGDAMTIFRMRANMK